MRAIQFLLLLGLSGLAQAEVYFGLERGMSLADIKGIYPDASFQKIDKKWQKDSDASFILSDKKINAVTVLYFDDFRPSKRATAKKVGGASNIFYCLANLPDDVALKLVAVEWTPVNPLPLSELKAKYGEPSRKGYADSPYDAIPMAPGISLADYQKSFVPFVSWDERSVIAFQNRDNTDVRLIIFGFTEAESKSSSWTTKNDAAIKDRCVGGSDGAQSPNNSLKADGPDGPRP